MAIVINGSGTVTGLAVGGLPDGTVDTGTLAANSVVTGKIVDGTIASADIANLVASKLTGALPAISGASLTGVNSVNGGRKNVIINGDMQVAQRATTSTSTGYRTVDRWQMGANVGVTQSHLALTSGEAYDAGFRSAFKLTNTGAIDTTASQYVSCFQNIEAQSLAKSGWSYTKPSSSITISFWIKSSVAGTYYVNPMSQDGTKKVYPQSFSLNANAWTKVEKTYVGLSSLTFANDTGNGMQLHISPFYGTNFTASSVSTSAWSNYGSATRFPDFAQNWGASTGATWEITGVQLELGSVATNFEHRSYGEELALCQRYYCQSVALSGLAGANIMTAYNTDNAYGRQDYPVTMRGTPSVTLYGYGSGSGKIHKIGSPDIIDMSAHANSPTGFSQVQIGAGSAVLVAGALYGCNFAASSEL